MAEIEAGKKLILIDALSLVFRAFHAPMQMDLRSPTGLPTKAIYIFVRTLQKIMKDQRSEYVAVSFDLAAPTFRDKLFEAYKANRPPFPEELAVQLPYVRRFCRALGLPLVEKEGYEADDVLGTLAGSAAQRGMNVFIVSGDEDLFQLVNDSVRVLKPSRGANESETLCDAAKVEEILGVRPAQVVDWLALTGDPSDNIPGARPLPGQEPRLEPGAKKRSYIGPKGATEIIKKFGTLENALQHFEQVEKQSYREALRDFRAEALLSRDLATIRTDVPLGVGPADLKRGGEDFAELRALCQELGFTTLLREFLEAAPAPVEAAAESEELATAEAISEWLEVSIRTLLWPWGWRSREKRVLRGASKGWGFPMAAAGRARRLRRPGSRRCAPFSPPRPIPRWCTTRSCCGCSSRNRASGSRA